MTAVESKRWRPSSDLRWSAWLAFAVLVAASWGGFLLFVLGLRGVAAVLCLVLVIVYFLMQVRAIRLLETEPGLEAQERTRLQSQLKFFGPAGIVVLAWRCWVAK